MHHFQHRSGELYAEDIPLREIAARVGTPCYVYSLATLRRHYRVFDEAFAATPHLVCFSVKANSNLAVLRTFAREGSGFDIVSGGELFRALRAGADPGKIVFSGVGKTYEEIAYALRSGILMFNVESPGELDTINAAAGALGIKARVALRVNPDVDPQDAPVHLHGPEEEQVRHSHPALDRGLPAGPRDAAYRGRRRRLPHRLAAHHRAAVHRRAAAGARSRRAPARPRTSTSATSTWAAASASPTTTSIRRSPRSTPPRCSDGLRGLDLTLVLEPGRVIVGNAGILLTKVLYLKSTDEKNFVVVDGGMNDLIRPALYGSYQGIEPVVPRQGTSFTADVVGPVCESGDFFAKDRELPALAAGDLLAVMSAGAYGFVMASNYNTRPRPPEILVDGSTMHIVRERETLDDLIRGETMPPALEGHE